MWIAILFGGLVLFILHAVYFSGRLRRALEVVVPRSRRWLRPVRIGYLVVALSLPVLILGYAVYVLIAQPDGIGAPDSAAWDYLVLFPFWLVTLHAFQCSLLIIPIDLLHLGLRRFGVATGEGWQRGRSLLVLFIAGGFAVYMPIRMALDSSGVEVREHDYVSADLPAELDGFRIALVADLQADRYTGPERLDELVEATNAARPDLVLIAGDLITRDPRYIPLAAEYAGRLVARHGVFACVGDHDNFAYLDRVRSLREVVEALARRGVSMLDNQVRTVPVGGAAIAVVFATNNYVVRIDRATTRKLLDQARAGDLQVVLAHQAGEALVADAEAAGVDLFLAGHTHGGQIRFWLPFYDLTPVRFETRYLEGRYRIGDMMLAVTSGLGTSVAPYRYRSPAAIDIVRLRRAP